MVVGGALRRRSGEQDVFSRAHTWEGQGDLTALQPAPDAAAQLAALLLDGHAELAQGGQMEVDGTGAELAPSRKGEHGGAGFSGDGSQKDDGGPHLPHQVVGDIAAGQPRVVHQDPVPFPLDPASQMAEDRHRGVHIGQARAVLELRDPVRHQGGRQDRQRAVFRAVHGDRAVQTMASFNEEL